MRIATIAALLAACASQPKPASDSLDAVARDYVALTLEIGEREPAGRARAARIVAMVLQFGEKNPGMARVMVGDALVFEHQRLQQRMNQFFDKLDAALRQSLRDGALADSAEPATLTPDADARVRASVLTAFVAGRLQRFARSGFRRAPSEQLGACIARML